MLSFVFTKCHIYLQLFLILLLPCFTLGLDFTVCKSVPHVPSHGIFNNPAKYHSHFAADETEAQRMKCLPKVDQHSNIRFQLVREKQVDNILLYRGLAKDRFMLIHIPRCLPGDATNTIKQQLICTECLCH